MKKTVLLLIFLICAAGNALKAQVIEPKVNLLAAGVAIVNPALEVGFAKSSAVQLDIMASFAKKNYMGTGYPFMMTMGMMGYRYYTTRKFDHSGFFVGADLGFGTFRMNKNIIPFVRHDHDKDTYDVGNMLVVGLTVGYKFVFAKRFGLELVASGGWSHANHEKYNAQGVRVVDMNASGEWMPYRAGICFSYRFGSDVRKQLGK